MSAVHFVLPRSACTPLSVVPAFVLLLAATLSALFAAAPSDKSRWAIFLPPLSSPPLRLALAFLTLLPLPSLACLLLTCRAHSTPAIPAHVFLFLFGWQYLPDLPLCTLLTLYFICNLFLAMRSFYSLLRVFALSLLLCALQFFLMVVFLDTNRYAFLKAVGWGCMASSKKSNYKLSTLCHGHPPTMYAHPPTPTS
jgi:hypothetical protein